MYSRYVSYAGAQPLGADFIEVSRCRAARFDVRCQLRVDHSGAHIAMTRHASSRRDGFAVWTPEGRSSWEYLVGPQDWAPTFPRVA
jgi:hypothetical protein